MHIFQLSNWLNSSFWEQYRSHKHDTEKQERKKKKKKVQSQYFQSKKWTVLYPGGYRGVPTLDWERSSKSDSYSRLTSYYSTYPQCCYIRTLGHRHSNIQTHHIYAHNHHNSRNWSVGPWEEGWMDSIKCEEGVEDKGGSARWMVLALDGWEFEILHLAFGCTFFSYPKRCEKTCTVQSCGLKGFGGGVVAHNSFIKTTSPQCHQLGKPHPLGQLLQQKARTQRKSAKTRPKSVLSLRHSFSHTLHIHTHSHTLNTNGWSYKSLKYRWTKTVTSSSMPLLRSQLPFLRSQSPSHHCRSPCSQSSPSLLLSVHEKKNRKKQTKNQLFFFPLYSQFLWQSKNMLIPPSCGCCTKHYPSPLNPSLQISGTCWHRCVCPSHAAPWYVSDKEPPGRI